MIRLGLLIAALIFLMTLTVLTTSEDMPEEEVAVAERPVASRPERIAPPVNTGDELIDHSAVEQTPTVTPAFPGPALSPSPTAGTPAVASDIPEGKRLYVTGNRVNFRDAPSTAGAVIQGLPRGTPLEEVERLDNGWVRLKDTLGRTGYMSGEFLSSTAP